jgi:type 1 glutamine amidotransferase
LEIGASRGAAGVLSVVLEKQTPIAVKGQKRADKDHAVSWIKGYGEGRGGYCSLGHNNAVYWNRAVAAHYLAGIQYALGDLTADDTPSVGK